jgi:BlaI family penicillinase repressor
MEKLTKAEEEIMQIIWKLDKCLVRDIIEHLGDPDIPHSTVSSVVRILEKKGFLDHKAYGRTYEYFPIIAKEDYSKEEISSFLSKYFKGSAKRLVSFLVKEKDLSVKELAELMKTLNNNDAPENEEE